MNRACGVLLVGLSAKLVTFHATIQEGRANVALQGLSPFLARMTSTRLRHALASVGASLRGRVVSITMDAALSFDEEAVDLPVVIAALAALDLVPMDALESTAFIGALGRDGRLRNTRGILPKLDGAAQLGFPRAIVPRINAREAAHATGLDVRVADHLRDVLDHLRGGAVLETPLAVAHHDRARERVLDALPSDVRHALDLAVKEHHNVLLVGAENDALHLVVRALRDALPPLTMHEAIAITKIHSSAGLVDEQLGLVMERPFRAPHSTTSSAGLLGNTRPGELSLAHLGMLVLDPLDAFRERDLLAILDALDAGHVTNIVEGHPVTFPARPLLVGLVCALDRLTSARLRERFGIVLAT